MKLQRSPGMNPVLLFVVPVVQIPLALLFFVLLGAPFLLHPGIPVSLPTSPFVLSTQRETQVVTIAPPPSMALYFENQETSLEGFRRALDSLRGKPQTLVIRADRKVLYDRVAAVMNIALDHGFPVVLATTEDSGLP